MATSRFSGPGFCQPSGDLAVHDEFTLFLSTHSTIVIDRFSLDDEVQIVHVSQTARTLTPVV
jgi:hypothetical protein